MFGLPDVYYRETPPEVDCNYMARPDEIGENARKARGIIDGDENLKYIREHWSEFSEQQLERWSIAAILCYPESLHHAIADDNLIEMRRFEHLDTHLESFESAAQKMKTPESRQRINDNLTVCDPEDDEEFGDDFDEDCSETEHPESEPEEDFQLKFF